LEDSEGKSWLQSIIDFEDKFWFIPSRKYTEFSIKSNKSGQNDWIFEDLLRELLKDGCDSNIVIINKGNN